MSRQSAETACDLLNIGTHTRWGVIEAVLWSSERLYMMRDRWGTVAVMPADVVLESLKEN